MRSLLVAALLAPLAAAPAAALLLGASSSATTEDFAELMHLVRPAPGPLGPHAAATPVDLYSEFHALALAGHGPALAWCARHHHDAPAELVPDPESDAELYVRLALDHADAPWLLDPELDPVRSIERAAEPVRAAAARSLAAATVAADGEVRALSLLMRAAALAPRRAPDASRRARALELLAEFAEHHAASPLARRSADLAWRIERLGPGLAAPQLALADVDGNELRLDHLAGRAVLVDVWSLDDPHLTQRIALRRSLLARHAPGSFAILGIGHDPDQLGFRRRLEEVDLAWPTSFERGPLGAAAMCWRLDRAPTTVLVDAAGVVRAVGLEGAELESALQQVLDAPAQAAALPSRSSDPRTPGADPRASDR